MGAKAQSVTALKQLVDNKSYSQAYDMSLQLMEEWGGEPGYDYLAGVAAFRTGHFQEAVFAFERVTIVKPDSIPARTYLAFSYFKVDNYAAAKTELTRLLNVDLPAAQQQQVKDYLQQIEDIQSKQREQQTFIAAITYAYDSNINSGTELDTIVLPVIGEIELFAGSQATADRYLAYNLNYQYQQRITQKSSFNLGLSFNHQPHDKSESLNRTTPSVIAGYQHQTGQWDYRLSAYVQPMNLDNKLYRVAAGVTANASVRMQNNWLITLGGGLADADNRQSDRQDLRQYNLSGSATYIGQPIHTLTLIAGQDDAYQPGGEHNGKRHYTASYLSRFIIDDKQDVTLDLMYQRAEYDALHPTFLTIRDDKTIGAGLNYNYQWSPNWQMSVQARYTDKQSNIALYEYDKSEVRLTASYQY